MTRLATATIPDKEHLTMHIFGLYIGSGASIANAMLEASLDTARACERLAKPRGLECDGEYGRGRAEAERDIRKLGDELARDLHSQI